MRSALRAGVGLSVESPVLRIMIFGLAKRAHREGCHGRGRTVVGQIANNRETRPTVRAVDKWVAVAAVSRGLELVQAVFANGDVWRHGSAGRGCTLAGENHKVPVVSGVNVFRLEGINHGERRPAETNIPL